MPSLRQLRLCGRLGWTVRASDAEPLAAMVTDDVGVGNGNGRCVCSQEELEEDFLKGFEACSIEQSVSKAEVVVRGTSAFEISEVESRLRPLRGGEATHVRSTTVVAFSQQRDGSWKVGRVLGLVQP
jgi:ketosteroid isomerase-like protein